MPRLLRPAGLLALALVAACARPEPPTAVTPPGISREVLEMYGERQDGDHVIPAISPRWLVGDKARQEVDYWTDEPPGTIVIDPYARRVYYVLPGDRAIRYSAGVGEAGRGFSGHAYVPFKRAWPHWTPTPGMIRRDPVHYEPVRAGLDGGPDNPLGARALYLYKNGKDTLYRIHGTPYPWTVGDAVSSGCIRLFNQDALDLYDRAPPGTRVVVLTAAESGAGTRPPGTYALAPDPEPTG